MKRLLGIILLFSVFSSYLFSQTTVKVDLLKSSWLAIHGTTNVLPFKLIQDGEKLLGQSITMTATESQNKIYLSQNQLTILVKNFSSENPMALRDFKKLIKADIYTSIRAQLNYIETLPVIGNDLHLKGNVSVNITIAGVEKQFTIPVSSNRHGEYVSVVGGKKISIRDFGLEPPTEMLGFIKVSEWVSIDFNMICRLTFDKDNLAIIN